MIFNKKHKVIIKSLSKDETKAFIKFLQSEIIRHKDDINQAKSLIEYVRKEILNGNNDVLCLDHINGGGTQERKETPRKDIHRRESGN